MKFKVYVYFEDPMVGVGVSVSVGMGVGVSISAWEEGSN